MFILGERLLRGGRLFRPIRYIAFARRVYCTGVHTSSFVDNFLHAPTTDNKTEKYTQFVYASWL